MKRIIKNSAALRRIYYRLQMMRAKGQSNESKIISELIGDAPNTFVEFGFHPIEFNCAALARDPDWRGVLIDGNSRQVEDARSLFPNRINVIEAFLTLENLGFIKSIFSQIGVLSIDVDGNDFWFLKELIDTNPAVICVEYNSSFGHVPITVPYDPSFDRDQKHPRGWYHGASLSALTKLCASKGYGLAAVADGGANAFFTRRGRLDPVESWRPNTFREAFSGLDHAQQWNSVSNLPFIWI